MANDPFAIDDTGRSSISDPIPVAKYKSGFEATQEPHEYFNQVIFRTVTDHVWGTQTQVTNGDATFYTDSSGNPLDKNDDAVVLVDDDRILITHNATLAANLLLTPATSKILHIDMLKGVSLNFGNAGSGVPFKMILHENINKGSTAKIRGTFDFRESSIARADKRLIANHARGVKIDYNEWNIYNPAHSGDIVFKDTVAPNPYLIEYNGQALDWVTNATNLTKAWFRDLNIFGDGLIDNGTIFVETRSRFTDPGLGPAYKFQVNTGFGFFRQLSVDDPDIHTRTDRSNISIPDTGSIEATFTSGSSVVTFDIVTDVKNGMRINGADARGVPDSTDSVAALGTTILKDIDTTAKTATMIDALTGEDIHTTATITSGALNVTMDNSGAAGGSKQLNSIHSHIHVQGNSSVPAQTKKYGFTDTGISSSHAESGGTIASDDGDNTSVPISDGVNGNPNLSSENRPQSILTNYYQRA